ncbi:MAG: hydrogen peroxide-inducible genes activator [Bacteroidia bacterium]|nr:hydrogen peroxide-inducible genes activator [Bacteroidia bacterium]MDW8300883.1 hydrogen peroxide-inducible genes activator [Bacteroidia bacterium]
MNLHQLEYLIAVAETQSFVKAAEKCFVTQATLSTMIKKLEEELGLVIFERTQPIQPTPQGKEVIYKAKKILEEVKNLQQYTQEVTESLSGDIKIGIIPTLAPYLIPLFLPTLNQQYQNLRLHIQEQMTHYILEKILQYQLDIGILAMPIENAYVSVYPLFVEPFYVYCSETENLSRKKYVSPEQININHLWLLEEGHCLRGQLLKICSSKASDVENKLFYQTGSLQSLINLVDTVGGLTIIPKLAIYSLNKNQRKNLREFMPPQPYREIVLVTHQHYQRKKIVQTLVNIIQQSVCVPIEKAFVLN